MCLPLRIFEWGPQLKIVARTCPITVPSLMLLPQSAQLSYFLHHMAELLHKFMKILIFM